MNSTVTVKYQTTIPKPVRDQLGISIHDALEWIVEQGKVVVLPVHDNFSRYRGSVKTGTGDIASDIAAARETQIAKYR
jgi:AbrB family looped-hinge helix DNA binding protein